MPLERFTCFTSLGPHNSPGSQSGQQRPREIESHAQNHMCGGQGLPQRGAGRGACLTFSVEGGKVSSGTGRSGVAMKKKQPKVWQGPCTERQPPRPVWEAGRGSHKGEPGTAPSPPCWEEEAKAGPWGPGGEPARRGCCQGGHRGAGSGEGANPRDVEDTWA